MTERRRRVITGGKRVVIKLGSMVLAAPDGGVDRQFLNRLA